ncbi:helix-turn-helix domain-containing protein [Streptomyces violarus]|nr:helix-turn-helix domain-containing protein [Streptomyces violarus]MCT9144698.1 helix-turn-helix domain-containing protein [Streptomyces violarus]
MKELAGRLTALDPDAGAAVRVIAYFDRLAESRAGVEALVRGAAVLSGCPARLVDPERRVHVRVEPDGTRQDTETPPNPTWPSARLTPNGPAILWLERGGTERDGDAVEGAGPGPLHGGGAAEQVGVTPGRVVTKQDGAEPGTADTDVTGGTPIRVDAAQAGAATGRVVTEQAGAAPGRVVTKQAGAEPGTGTAELAGAAPGQASAGDTGATPSQIDAKQAGAAPGVVMVVTKQGRAAGVVIAEDTGAAPGQVVAQQTGAAPGTVVAESAAPALSVVDAVILERAAAALRLVLDRTRGRAPADDPALVETLLDATAPEQARLYAARRLGLDATAPARVLAPLNNRPLVVPAGRDGASHGGPGVAESRPASPDARFAAGRLGVGPAVPVLELPRSWAEARTALRFTSEGTSQDPGPRVVYADELGGIALLADLVVPGAEPPPDVRALETAAATAPWLPATLHAVASTASLRAAAAGINVHHSTLQDRLTHAEHLLGWPVRTPQGRLRLQLALAMRRLARP